MGGPRTSGKPFDIPKELVWEAFQRVRANKGAPGVDGVSVEAFEADLKNNLYLVWNRLSSGTWFPPPVRTVDIPKPHDRGTRTLGIPTVADRVAQTAVGMVLEARVETIFDPDSYAYRPGRHAVDAVGVCRDRCGKRDWVVELDIQSFFDSCPHGLVVQAVRANTDLPWVVLYVRRWLAADVRHPDGSLTRREKGTPQGAPISPVLANLFLHYAFDLWIRREFPTVQFERYADDIVVHCVTERQARTVRSAVAQRLTQVGLRLHPTKTRIVYCRDWRRRGTFPIAAFTFLGYTFRTRLAWSTRARRRIVTFSPGMSREARTARGRQVRRWRIHRWVTATLEDIAEEINPVVRGWMNYYGQFNRSQMNALLERINIYLVRWARGKYKRLRGRKRLMAWWRRIVRTNPTLFAHWRWMPGFPLSGW